MSQNVKPKHLRYLEDNKITSVLNDAKWNRLFDALVEISWTLDFQRKDLEEAEPNEDYWDSDIYHVMGHQASIEWLNIRAIVSKCRGALVEPEVKDNIDILLLALHKAGTPYAMYKDGVRVWGYLRPGVYPDWMNT